MKKLLALILTLILSFNCALVFAAQPSNSLEEDKTARIVINGAAFKPTNILLLKNGSPMLSTDYINALGITGKNLSWDKSKKKITLIKGTTKLTLELDSSNYTLNGKKGLINIKPFTYKGKTYFPAELIATSFGNKFIPDAHTNTYFIKNNADFTNNKKRLGQILTNMNNLYKIKVSKKVELKLNGNGVKLNNGFSSLTLTNRLAKVLVANVKYATTTNGKLSENNVQMVLYNNKYNLKVDDADWSSLLLSNEEVDLQFDFKDILSNEDLVCAALTATNSSNKNEIILKGNIIMGNSIPVFLTSQGLLDNNIIQKSIEMTVNKNTNIINSIVLKESGNTLIANKNVDFSIEYVIKYSDFNGSFEVVVPNELK